MKLIIVGRGISKERILVENLKYVAECIPGLIFHPLYL